MGYSVSIYATQQSEQTLRSALDPIFLDELRQLNIGPIDGTIQCKQNDAGWTIYMVPLPGSSSYPDTILALNTLSEGGSVYSHDVHDGSGSYMVGCFEKGRKTWEVIYLSDPYPEGTDNLTYSGTLPEKAQRIIREVSLGPRDYVIPTEIFEDFTHFRLPESDQDFDLFEPKKPVPNRKGLLSWLFGRG